MIALIEALPHLLVTLIYGWAAISTWRLLRRGDGETAAHQLPGNPHKHERGSAVRYMLLSIAYAWIVSLHVIGPTVGH